MNRHFKLLLFFLIVVCLYLMFSLFIFIRLQGDMQDWFALVRNNASLALFSLFCITGVVGTGIMILKKDIRILDAPPKILGISFLLTIIFGLGALTYLNYNATEANYTWLTDGFTYQQMGQSFLLHGEFILYGEYTHHMGPVYPIYLSIFYALPVPVHIATQVAIEIIFVVSLVVVFLTSRRLYGMKPALVTTGLMATLPTYVFFTSRNYAEPMILIWYTLTIFFIIESLQPEKENRIILAGLCAALGYLTKSSLGYFFLISGIIGFFWRFYYMKWGVLKNKNYIIAIMVFFSLFLAWGARNLYHFWNGTILDLFVSWQSSEYFLRAANYSLGEDFGRFFVEFWFFIVLTTLLMLSYAWIFLNPIKKTFRRIRDTRVSCLYLAIILPLLICWIMGAILFVYECHWQPPEWGTSYDPISQVRYLVFHLVRFCFISVVPLSWLAYESRRFDVTPDNTYQNRKSVK